MKIGFLYYIAEILSKNQNKILGTSEKSKDFYTSQQATKYFDNKKKELILSEMVF